jgi:hypothetical protein
VDPDMELIDLGRGFLGHGPGQRTRSQARRSAPGLSRSLRWRWRPRACRPCGAGRRAGARGISGSNAAHWPSVRSVGYRWRFMFHYVQLTPFETDSYKNREISLAIGRTQLQCYGGWVWLDETPLTDHQGPVTRLRS